MKKLLVTLLTVVLLLSLTACVPAAPAVVTVDGPYDGEGYTFTPPSGWTISEESGGVVFLPSDYPTNPNGIVVTLGEVDPDFDGYDEAHFENLYVNVLTDFELLSCEKTEIAGRGAYVLSYSMTSDETAMVQHQYIIDAPSATLSFTFVQANGDMSETMEACIGSLELH